MAKVPPQFAKAKGKKGKGKPPPFAGKGADSGGTKTVGKKSQPIDPSTLGSMKDSLKNLK